MASHAFTSLSKTPECLQEPLKKMPQKRVWVVARLGKKVAKLAKWYVINAIAHRNSK